MSRLVELDTKEGTITPKIAAKMPCNIKIFVGIEACFVTVACAIKRGLIQDIAREDVEMQVEIVRKIGKNVMQQICEELNNADFRREMGKHDRKS